MNRENILPNIVVGLGGALALLGVVGIVLGMYAELDGDSMTTGEHLFEFSPFIGVFGFGLIAAGDLNRKEY